MSDGRRTASPAAQQAAPSITEHDDDATAGASADRLQSSSQHSGGLGQEPAFEPLFTLLTNATTNTTTHPRVHYIFSDDDPSILSTTDPSRRNLIIDLAPAPDADAPSSPWKVASASSLSPDFAITASKLAEQQHGNDAMLRLEGVEREPVEMTRDPAEGEDRAAEDKEGLVEDYKRRMDLLRKVVEVVSQRSRAVGAGQEAVADQPSEEAVGEKKD